MSRHIALVPAAGSGRRMGAERPKQYLPVAGRPLIFHTLNALCRFQAIAETVVVLAPDDEWWGRFDWSDFSGRLRVMDYCGEARAQTVLNALTALADEMQASDWVLVHDAARPCVSPQLLTRLVAELRDDAVGGLLALRVADTLKRADDNERSAATVERRGLWQAQTPQMFRYGLLREALAARSDVTEDRK